MGTCFERLVTEEWRRNLLLIISILNCVLSVYGAFLLIIGIKIKVLLQELDPILDKHYNGALPIMLIFTGCLMIVTHSTLAFLAFRWSNWTTRPLR